MSERFLCFYEIFGDARWGEATISLVRPFKTIRDGRSLAYAESNGMCLEEELNLKLEPIKY